MSINEKPCGRRYQKFFYLIIGLALLFLVGYFWQNDLGSQEKIQNRFSASMQPNQMQQNQTRAVNIALNVAPSQNMASSMGQVQNMPQSSPVYDRFTVLAAYAKPRVVNISAIRTTTPPVAQQALTTPMFATPSTGKAVESIGSGIILTEDGYILTNFHIIENAEEIYASVFTEDAIVRHLAEVIDLSAKLDLALIKINPKVPLKPAVLSNEHPLRVGEEILAIGSPFGLDQTVSKGIISSLNKTIKIGTITHKNLIQTDAAINRGNSGGPLVDNRGYVVGIATAIYTPNGAFAGIGFAVPSFQALDYAQDFVTLPNLRPDPQATMVNVAAVRAMPILPGAVRLHENRGECTTCHQIIGNSQTGPGAQAKPVTVAAVQPVPILPGAVRPHLDRGECSTCHQIIQNTAPTTNTGNQFVSSPFLNAQGVTAAFNQPQPNGRRVQMGGLYLQKNTQSGQGLGLRRGLGFGSGSPTGVVINDVIPGSPFAQAGLIAGDTICRVDGRKVFSADDFANFTKGKQGNVRLSILRDGRRSDVSVMLDANSLQSTAANTAPMMAPAQGNRAMSQGSPTIIIPNQNANRRQNNRAYIPGNNRTFAQSNNQTFAQGNNTATQTPPTPAQTPPTPALNELELLGMELVPTPDGTVRVAEVSANSLAGMTGILMDDIILTIDGNQVTKLEIVDQLLDPTKLDNRIEIQRQNQILVFLLK